MDLISLLVILLIIVVVYWAGHKIAGAFGAPPQVVVIFDVILVIVGIYLLLGLVGWAPPMRIR